MSFAIACPCVCCCACLNSGAFKPKYLPIGLTAAAAAFGVWPRGVQGGVHPLPRRRRPRPRDDGDGAAKARRARLGRHRARRAVLGAYACILVHAVCARVAAAAAAVGWPRSRAHAACPPPSPPHYATRTHLIPKQTKHKQHKTNLLLKDPLADGQTIHTAATRALQRGTIKVGRGGGMWGKGWRKLRRDT